VISASLLYYDFQSLAVYAAFLAYTSNVTLASNFYNFSTLTPVR